MIEERWKILSEKMRTFQEYLGRLKKVERSLRGW